MMIWRWVVLVERRLFFYDRSIVFPLSYDFLLFPLLSSVLSSSRTNLSSVPLSSLFCPLVLSIPFRSYLHHLFVFRRHLKYHFVD